MNIAMAQPGRPRALGDARPGDVVKVHPYGIPHGLAIVLDTDSHDHDKRYVAFLGNGHVASFPLTTEAIPIQCELHCIIP